MVGFSDRHLAGYSPWGRKELDTTEHAHKYTLLFLHSEFQRLLELRASLDTEPMIDPFHSHPTICRTDLFKKCLRNALG